NPLSVRRKAGCEIAVARVAGLRDEMKRRIADARDPGDALPEDGPVIPVEGDLVVQRGPGRIIVRVGRQVGVDSIGSGRVLKCEPPEVVAVLGIWGAEEDRARSRLERR